MATGQLNGVVHRLRTTLLSSGGGMTDGHLLERFIAARDEAAFEALVRRHGPMVLGVCRRLLRHAQDAEDAFQATFFVLARKAASLVQRELVGNWLYGAAYRAALQARATRRRLKERQVSAMPEPETADESDVWRELQPVLDRELSRLPDKYRVPVVLCDLQGRTRREVARQLGIPEGTLSGRLTTARRTLAQRLARHGLAVSGGALATILSQNAASACLPAELVSHTCKAATLFPLAHPSPAGVVGAGTRGVAKGGAAAQVSARVAALTEGVLKTMFLSKLKTASAVLVVAALAVFGFGYLAGLPEPGLPAGEKKTKKVAKKAVGPPPDEKKASLLDSKSWEVLATLDGHKDRVDSVAFSREGNLLATASYDGTVMIWEVATGKKLATLNAHDGEATKVAFAPDGKTVATAGEDKTARVWDWAKGQELQRFTHNDPVYSVLFTPDGKTLIAGGGHNDIEGGTSRGELRLWDPETGKERAKPGAGHNNRVAYLAFTPDGKTLVTGGHDNTFKFWDFDGKEELRERQSVEAGQTQGLYGLALSRDGKTLAVTCDGGTLKLYDVATGKERDALEGSKSGLWDALSFSSDGKTLVANRWWNERDGDFFVTNRADIRLWDVTTGKVIETFKVKKVIETLAFAPDGTTLAVAGRGELKVPAMGDVIVGGGEETKDGPVLLLRKKDEGK